MVMSARDPDEQPETEQPETGSEPGPGSAARPGREFDVVLYGASGFVGRLVAAYLAEHAPTGCRIALAGRSPARLQAVRQQLPAVARAWPLLIADSSDESTLADLATRTRALASTVGPYARHGLALVRACAEAGTHYADLTGEVLFVRQSIDRFDQIARSTGARIVHSCGVDSVPSDLGVLLLHERALADGAGGLVATTAVMVARGGVSGGTIDSMRVQVDSVSGDPSARRLVTDPYGLSPDRAGEPDLGDERETSQVWFDEGSGGWVGPFVMAPFNTRVVRRSNALRGWAYGRTFRYRELTGFGPGVKGRAAALAATGALGGLMFAMTKGPLRRVVDRVLPDPGEGPSEQTRANGFFRLRLRTTTGTGARYLATVAAKGDPGYAATSVMLGESALALALDGPADGLPAAAGVLTPATGIGTALVQRLRLAGFTLQVEPA
jgi:short subunit dehydrogenase-like uncharacterized protein